MKKLIVRLRFCLIFIIIASVGSVMNMFNHFYLVMSTLVAFVLLLVDREINLVQVFRRSIIFCLIVLLCAVFTNSDVSQYRNIFSNSIFISILFGSYNGKVEYLKRDIGYSLKIVSYLGVINIILYIFFPFLFSYMANDVGYSINTVAYIFNYSPHSESVIPRNPGLYWEPGVFQLIINIYLYYILIEEKQGINKVIIPIFLIFTTQSTTGLVTMFVIILYKFIKSNNKPLGIYKLLFCFFIIIAAPIIYNNVQTKLFGDLAGSSQARFFDYFMGINVMMSHPFLGIGLDPEKYMSLNEAVDIPLFNTGLVDTVRPNTNSFISIGVYFGIPIMITYIIALYKQRIFQNQKLFFLVLFLGLLSEPLYNSMLVLMFFFSLFWLNDNSIKPVSGISKTSLWHCMVK